MTFQKLVHDCEPVVEKIYIANTFHHFFTTVFSSNDSVSPVFNEYSDIPAIDGVPLSYEGIFSILLKVDPSKSEGPDEVTNSFLKSYSMVCQLCLDYFSDMIAISFYSRRLEIG